jgi:hypothetical protein
VKLLLGILSFICTDSKQISGRSRQGKQTSCEKSGIVSNVLFLTNAKDYSTSAKEGLTSNIKDLNN